MVTMAVSAGLAQFLEDCGEIVSKAMTWMSTAFTTISSNAILMAIVFGLPLVGLGIGMLGRLLRTY